MADMVDIKRYLSIVWKWLWLIVLCMGIATGVSYYVTKSMPPVYVTSLTVMVGQSTADPNVDLDSISASQQLVDAYADMVRREPILDATVKSLGLGINWRQLRDQVAVNRTANQILEVRVSGEDPVLAKSIADELVHQLVLQSPTAENMRELEGRRAFIKQEMDALQTMIAEAEASLAQKQTALANEVSARGVMDLEDQIGALETKLSTWRSSYASLLPSYIGKGPNTLTVIEPSYVPTEPASPNIEASVLMAAALGLLLALAGAFAIEYANDVLSTPEEVTQALALPTLGSVIRWHKGRNQSGSTGAQLDSRPPVPELYRLLRTNVQFSCVDDDVIMLLVTSPGPQEGKSVTAANLAISFARNNMRTVLVDADLRRPSLHTLFGVTNETGLTSLLLRDRSGSADDGAERKPRSTQDVRHLADYLLPTGVPSLSLLTSGSVLPVSQGDLLASKRMEEILSALKSAAQVVIIDSPPVLSLADAPILAAKGVAVLLVLEAGKTRTQAGRAAVESLTRARARLLGVVLNKTPQTAFSHYYRTYRYDGGAGGWLGRLKGILPARRRPLPEGTLNVRHLISREPRPEPVALQTVQQGDQNELPPLGNA